VTVSVQTWLRHDSDLAMHRPPPTPIAATHAEWHSRLWQSLPHWREDIWQRENQPLDIQYAGTLDDLNTALASRGWEHAKPLDWGTALSLFSPELPLQELPVPPQVHAGRHEASALVKRLPEGGRLVLRLWRTPYRLDGAPLWIGNVTAQRKDLVLNLLAIPATVPEFAGPRVALERDLTGLPAVSWEVRESVILAATEGDGDHPP
jgi:undecaprenyl-diphosphatase